MKEIGGYFEFERYGAGTYHTDAILLNTGRSALKYIIRAYGIKEIFIPYYTCPVVWDALYEEGCKITFYDINGKFQPMIEFPSDAYVLTNDWFGVCGGNVVDLADKYCNLIVDNAQSFYALPKGIGSFYSPRKFFGLPDGGLLICDKRIDKEFPRDTSYGRTGHLLKRLDLCAGDGYEDFKANEKSLSNQPIMEMSNLTHTLMGNIDYERTKRTRLENFSRLHDAFSCVNNLNFDSDIIVCPMVYPLLIEKKGLREKLIAARIYVARYWDDDSGVVPKDSFSAYLSKYLLPLPVDQRYGPEAMGRIINVVERELK